MRLAVSLPAGSSVEESLTHAIWAEENGFDDAWIADSGGPDALTLAAMCAMRLKRLRIGLAITPVFVRTPASLASAAATISHMIPNRFALGLGASSHVMMEGWHGVPFVKPRTRVKETIQLLHAMWQGEKTAFQGQILQSKGYRIMPQPKGALPIFVAALRGRMLELAGEVGEGVILNLFPYETLPRLLDYVARGAQKAGRSMADIEVVARHQMMITDDVKAGRALFRKHFTAYYATPVYNAFLGWCGYEAEAKAMLEGFKEGNRQKTLDAMHDDLVDRIATIGSAEHCMQRLQTMTKQGIHTHILAFLSPSIEQVEHSAMALASMLRERRPRQQGNHF